MPTVEGTVGAGHLCHPTAATTLVGARVCAGRDGPGALPWVPPSLP